MFDLVKTPTSELCMTWSIHAGEVNEEEVDSDGIP